MTFATRAKGAAGNHGHALFQQQPLGKFVFVHACLGDAGEGIKRTLWLKAVQPNRV